MRSFSNNRRRGLPKRKREGTNNNEPMKTHSEALVEVVGGPPQKLSAVSSAGDRREADALAISVYRQMRVLAGPHPDLDDLAQTALEQILRAKFENKAKFSTFTYAICHHVWLKHLRWSYRFRRLFSVTSPTELPDVTDSTGPSDRLDAEQRYTRLHAALEQLPVKQRAVVALREISELPVEEIAEVVGTSEATARTRLRDGRKRLATILAKDPSFSDDFSEPGSRNHE